MKMDEADIVWTPVYGDTFPGVENQGAIRVERHGSGWARTPGDRWMPATALGAMGTVSTKGDRTMQLLAMFVLG